jgi:hypothetical protein
LRSAALFPVLPFLNINLPTSSNTNHLLFDPVGRNFKLGVRFKL